MIEKLKNKKIALVTDWLTNIGGGEKVLKAISDLFPDAPIYTTVVNKENIGELAKREIRTSWLQKIPLLNKNHQVLLPWLPRAIESLDLSEFDIILSFSSSVAKSVITHPDQLHICYIHSPMRYAWEPFFDQRFKRIPRIFQPLVNKLLHKLRIWDTATSIRPDLYIANSTTTASRVKKYYRIPSLVLYPPVEVGKFKALEKKEDFYFGVGRMVNYKKFDLLVEAFQHIPNRRLIIAGDGPERKRIIEMAKGYDNIEILDRLSERELVEKYSKAKAFLLPQKEDAGIVQLEALASGTPVIAYKAGGALDVIKEGVNGVFFEEQKPESLVNAIEKFEKMKWDSDEIRKTSIPFDIQNFQKNYIKILSSNI